MPAKGKSLAELGRSLRTAARALAKAATLLKDSSFRPQAAGAAPKKRRPMSPKARRALKLHGSYLGYVRQLKPKQRVQIRAIREKRGVQAAIAEARRQAQRQRARG